MTIAPARHRSSARGLFVLLSATLLFVVGCDDGGGSESEDTSTTTDTRDTTPMNQDVELDTNASLAISDLVAFENPANPLSFFVSWTTDQPVGTELHADCGDDYQRTFESAETKTDHEVFVMGLYSGMTCTFTAQPSFETTGETSIDVTEIGNLPDDLPELTVNTMNLDLMEPGWTTFTVAGAATPKKLYAVIIDEQGRYRWVFSAGDANSGAGAEILPLEPVERGLLFGASLDHQGIVSWEGEPVYTLDENAHHDMRMSPWNERHLLYLSLDTSCGEHNAIEYDMDNQEVIWNWSICEYWTPRVEYGNWSHLNTLEPVPGERAVLISSRDQDTVHKVDRDTDELVWTLGRDGDFTMDPADHFFRQHAPEVQPDGHILILDNGVWENEAINTGLAASEAREYTRVLEFELTFDDQGNPDRADVVWDYTTEDIFAVNRSEADRLPNGNTLVHYVWVQPERTVILREVTEDKEIVWDVVTSPDTSSYRSERIDPYYGHVR